MCAFGHCLCFNLTRSYREFILVAVTKTKHLMKSTVFKFCLKLYEKEPETGKKKKKVVIILNWPFFPSIASFPHFHCAYEFARKLYADSNKTYMAVKGRVILP